MNERKQKNHEKGITLIALVITIVVLLILAGITIQALSGENGLLKRATEAKDKTIVGEIEEEISLWKIQNTMAKSMGESKKSLDEFLQELMSKDLLTQDEVNQINSSTNKEITKGGKTISFLDEEQQTGPKIGSIQKADGATYGFELVDGTLQSQNTGIDDSTANSYVIVDLTEFEWKTYYVKIISTISSEEDYDFGYIKVTEDGMAITYWEINELEVSGISENRTIIELEGGKKYYIHFGYEKDDEVLEGDDKFTINSIDFYEPDFNTILTDATANPQNYKHPKQSSSNGDIGIGTDGEPVNLDLWKYEVINGNEISLGVVDSCTGIPGYENNNIVGGKIIGKVPQYIKTEQSSVFYEVTYMGRGYGGGAFYGCTSLETAPTIPSTVKSMYYTFGECTSLTIVPTIPNSVTSMDSTFSECTNLEKAPTIPSSVTDMSCTFRGCTNLTTAPTIPNLVTDMDATFMECTKLVIAPTIPNLVTNMNNTFSGCTNLTTASIIPSSVTRMYETFKGCTKLTGDLIINATNVSQYYNCLTDAATATGTDLKLSGSCTKLSNILETKSTNSNISLK